MSLKPEILCLLLLSGCSETEFLPQLPVTGLEYSLTWTCQSPEGCERAEEVTRIDYVTREGDYFSFTSTQDPSFSAQGELIIGDALPSGCAWLYFLTLFGHELERSRLCRTPGGMELQLSIPNQDPTTFSMWLVEGRDEDIF